MLSNLYPVNVKQYLLTGYCCSYWGKRKIKFSTLDKTENFWEIKNQIQKILRNGSICESKIHACLLDLKKQVQNHFQLFLVSAKLFEAFLFVAGI